LSVISFAFDARAARHAPLAASAYQGMLLTFDFIYHTTKTHAGESIEKRHIHGRYSEDSKLLKKILRKIQA